MTSEGEEDIETKIFDCKVDETFRYGAIVGAVRTSLKTNEIGRLFLNGIKRQNEKEKLNYTR